MGKYSYFWGAFSLDVAHARSQFSQNYSSFGNKQGQAYRFVYSRGFSETNTTLNIIGYSYATQGYYNFDELQQIHAGYVDENRGESGNINLNYRGSYAQINDGYGRQKKYNQWVYEIGGGIVIHSRGITLSQPLSLDCASALVQAHGAANVKV